MQSFTQEISKAEASKEIETELKNKGFNIDDKDLSRPWGGFFVIDEDQSEQFIATYFPHLNVSDFEGFSKLSPKILLVQPDKRLSWQYHHRRAEIWKLIGGSAGVIVSDTDEQTDMKTLKKGDLIELRQGERHRLVGLDEWGVVAEIWKHTDPENPSDEEDIVRVEDDFGR